MTGCVIEGCTNPVKAHGWCYSHYMRWRRHGDPMKVERTQSVAEALMLRSERSGECLVWTGSLDRHGYGKLRRKDGTWGAHRAAYVLANGEIPSDLQIDHVCFNRACINPLHLRVVTHQENSTHRKGPNPNNKSTGRRNVYKNPRTGSYFVSLMVRGVTYYGGTFRDLEDADQAAQELRQANLNDGAPT